jgi:hypothetical protein
MTSLVIVFVPPATVGARSLYLLYCTSRRPNLKILKFEATVLQIFSVKTECLLAKYKRNSKLTEFFKTILKNFLFFLLTLKYFIQESKKVREFFLTNLKLACI